MLQKKYLLVIPVLIILGIGWFVFQQRSQHSSPLIPPTISKPLPSETLITYEDPAGFSFSYPDNISLSKNETEDTDIYSDLSLYSKDVSGSINLTISDSKLKNVEEWITDQQLTPTDPNKEVFLGSLKTTEVTTTDHIYLVGFDQGILFTIRMPRLEEEFWQPVYFGLRSNFAFLAPASTDTASRVAVEDATFEGEEVVE
jgi:hypothetical protein